MERVENALVRLVAFALLLEMAGAQRVTKLDHNRLWERPQLSNRQRAIRAVNRHRHSERLEAFEQNADAGLEGLELARGRDGAFGKPDEVIAALQHGSAKSQARNQGVIRVDRDNLTQPPEQADEWVGGDHAPVGPAQLTEAKCRGNHLWVEVTEVIGDEHERLLFRQASEPFDPQAKPGPHQHPVDRK